MSDHIATLDPAQALDRQRNGALIIDVRDLDEWEEEHVPDAMLIPLGELDDRRAEIPKDRELIVMCRSGRRSGEAQKKLAATGIATTNLEGGIEAWKKSGLPIIVG